MNKFEFRHALVIGGAGFIGSNLVDRLMMEGINVRVLDDFSNGSYSNIQKWKADEKFSLDKGDMRKNKVVNKALQDIDIVYLQAAKVSVPFSVKNPHLVLDVNVMGTTTVLDEVRKSEVKKIIVASSSSVYGDTEILPKIETMPTNPISPYAVSKLAQENLTIAFYKTYGINTTALRYFNVYGPRQRGGHYAGVMQIFAAQAMQNKPLTIDGDGQQTRDFTYVEDAVNANILAATSTKARGKVYNVGGGDRISIDHLADTIISITNSSSTKEYGPPRPGDVRNSLAGLDLIKKEINYTPKWNIEKGVFRTIEWIKNV